MSSVYVDLPSGPYTNGNVSTSAVIKKKIIVEVPQSKKTGIGGLVLNILLLAFLFVAFFLDMIVSDEPVRFNGIFPSASLSIILTWGIPFAFIPTFVQSNIAYNLNLKCCNPMAGLVIFFVILYFLAVIYTYFWMFDVIYKNVLTLFKLDEEQIKAVRNLCYQPISTETESQTYPYWVVYGIMCYSYLLAVFLSFVDSCIACYRKGKPTYVIVKIKKNIDGTIQANLSKTCPKDFKPTPGEI